MVKKLSLLIVAFIMCALPVLPNTLTVTRVEAEARRRGFGLWAPQEASGHR